MVSRAVLDRVLSAMPPRLAFDAQAYAWRTFSRLTRLQCVLRGLPLIDRIVCQLQALAPDFGKPDPHGVLVDLALKHDELGELVAGARSNVCRRLGTLESDGIVVGVPAHRFLLTHRGMARPLLRAVGDAAGAV
jgi:hypothetical protein